MFNSTETGLHSTGVAEGSVPQSMGPGPRYNGILFLSITSTMFQIGIKIGLINQIYS